jgi:hypothetical protein
MAACAAPVLALVLVLGGAVSASASAPPERAGACTHSTVAGLRLRTAPGLRAPVRGLLWPRDCLALHGQRWASGMYWRRVALRRRSAGGLRAGTSGWVARGYLTNYAG